MEAEIHEAKGENKKIRVEIKEERQRLNKENQGLSRALTRKHKEVENIRQKSKESEDEVAALMQILQKTQNQLDCEKRKNLSDALEEESFQDCPLCYETYNTANRQKSCSSSCGHIYCYSCLDKTSKDRKNNCPFCQKKIGQKIKLFEP